MKELLDGKFDVDEFIGNLLGEKSATPKERRVRLNLGLMGKNSVTVDGDTVPLPNGVHRLTAGAVKRLAKKYQGLILAREGEGKKATALSDEDVIDVGEENTFRTRKPAPRLRTLPRLGRD